MTSLAISPESRTRTRRDRGGRWLAFVIAVALHLLLLALFLGSHPQAVVGTGVGAGAMDLSLAGLGQAAAPSVRSAPRAQAPPVAPAPPAPPTPQDPIKPRSVLAIVSDILSIPLPEHSVTPTLLAPAPSPILAQAMAQASGSPGAACDIGGAVQTALRSDPETHGAFLLIPQAERSSANAVMMWNGQWIDPAASGGVQAFTVIRGAIRQIVAAARPECRDQAIVGPRFMLIAEPDVTKVVVFGNASWKWSDLLVDPESPLSFPK